MPSTAGPVSASIALTTVGSADEGRRLARLLLQPSSTMSGVGMMMCRTCASSARSSMAKHPTANLQQLPSAMPNIHQKTWLTAYAGSSSEQMLLHHTMPAYTPRMQPSFSIKPSSRLFLSDCRVRGCVGHHRMSRTSSSMARVACRSENTMQNRPQGRSG